MELRQLLYMATIAEEANFTRAAARVHVAQPAVSQQIAALERELGQKLFDRSGRQIRLTPAGAAFLPFAQAALQAADAGRDAVASLKGVLVGRLTIGTVQSPPELFVGLLGEFRRHHPHVDISLRIGHPEDLAADAAAGTLDAAVLGLTGQRLPSALATRTLAAEPLVVAVAPEHPLSRRTSVTLAALKDEPLVTLTHGSGLRTVLEAACAKAGFTPRIRAETDDVTLLGDLIHHGLGIAVVPRSVAERARGALATVELRRPVLRRKTVLAWRRDPGSAAGRAFVAFVQSRAAVSSASAG